MSIVTITNGMFVIISRLLPVVVTENIQAVEDGHGVDPDVINSIQI